MPLSPKQRKVIQEGYSHCLSCAEHLANMRRAGYPNEAAEERQQATQKTYEELFNIMSEFDNQAKKKG
jgi:hypothetical protein